MKILNIEQVMKVHSQLVSATGGSDGIRDKGLLESALKAPFQTFAGQDLYPTIFQKAVRLGFSIVNNHPFVDGNKRIGIHGMLIFLALNGIELDYEQDELIKVGLTVAEGIMDEQQLLEWVLSKVVGNSDHATEID